MFTARYGLNHLPPDFWWTKWDSLSPSTSIFPRLDHSTNALYPSSPTRCSYQKDKRAKPGNHPKSTAFRKSGSTEQNRTSLILKELILLSFLLIANENIRHGICLGSFLYGIQYFCAYDDTQESVQNFQPCGNFSRRNKLIVFFTNTVINLLKF